MEPRSLEVDAAGDHREGASERICLLHLPKQMASCALGKDDECVRVSE